MIMIIQYISLFQFIQKFWLVINILFFNIENFQLIAYFIEALKINCVEAENELKIKSTSIRRIK
jgi:hypothetical protein